MSGSGLGMLRFLCVFGSNPHAMIPEMRAFSDALGLQFEKKYVTLEKMLFCGPKLMIYYFSTKTHIGGNHWKGLGKLLLTSIHNVF